MQSKERIEKIVEKEVYMYKSDCGCETELMYTYNKYHLHNPHVSVGTNTRYIKKCEFHNTKAVEDALRLFFKDTKINWTSYRESDLPYLIAELNRVSGMSLCDIEKIATRIKNG